MRKKQKFVTLPSGVLAAWILTSGTIAQTPPPPQTPAPWAKLTNCHLIGHSSNDGDSFQVAHDGRRYVFRLFFVDTPETSNLKDLKQRILDQRKVWGISRSELFELAEASTDFTANALARPFTVFTRWEDAMGSGRERRYFAFVETQQGDLAELLVSAGLARIYGQKSDHPKGIPERNILRRLEQLQAEAKSARLGGWGMGESDSSGKPESRTAPTGRPSPAPERREIPAF